MMKMNKKGQGFFVVLLILVIFVLVYLNYLGGSEKATDFKEKIDKLNCPELPTNLTCEFGKDVFTDVRGCVIVKCLESDQPLNQGLGESALQVFFIDVGQGDSIYIETPQEKHILIDAGTGSLASDFLTFRGITKLDYVIETHPDSDHIGGLDEIFHNFVVSNFIYTDAPCDTKTCDAMLKVRAEEEGLNTIYGFTGQTLTLEPEVTFKIVSPNSDLVFNNDNDQSIVAKLTYGEIDILFTGDCMEDCEDMLLLLDKDISADVLKVAHHGSDSSTGAPFLSKVNASYAVLSYGENNNYGHPSKEVIDRLLKQQIKIVRTASAGDIELRTDGTRLEWHCEKKEDCFR